MRRFLCSLILVSAIVASDAGSMKSRLWPQNNFFDRITHRVDGIAGRIDQGIQQTVDQLHQNVRDTLNVWTRPFGGAAPPVFPPPPPPSREAPQSGFNPFDLNLSPLFQGLFDNQQRDWWKGPNICIEREEIDESKGPQNVSSDVPTTILTNPELEGEAAVLVDEDEDGPDAVVPVPEKSSRKSRQFSGTHIRMSSCSDEGLAYICQTKIRSNAIRKTYTTRYSCCHGTVREPGEFGCHAVEMRSLQETVFALGGRSFLTLLNEAEVSGRMMESNHTYFVPVDYSAPASSDSSNDVSSDGEVVSSNAELRRRREVVISRIDEGAERDRKEIRSTVLSHIVPGIYLTPDFKDEQILNTEDPDAKIRINMYNAPDRVYTANCVRLVSVNNYALQGVVHMLDGVMKPATKTLADLVASESHFSTFRKLIEKQNIMEQLQNPGQLTLFAPTDEAFAKLDADTREKLFQGEGCVHSVVKQHLLPNVICSTVIQGRARSTTVLGTSLLIEKDLEGKVYVNGKQVITRDVVATNGVLHVIDGVLIPENARSFTQLLATRNLTEMARLVEAAGMNSAFDSLTNATLFAPTNEAIRALPDSVKQSLLNNPEKLKRVLLNHIVQPEIHSHRVFNNQVFDTKAANHSLRINLYPTLPFFNALPARATAQCAAIVRWEQEACNGNVHLVDRVLIPPEVTIVQWLANNRSFSIMSKLLKDSRLAQVLEVDGPYTLLAVPDVAFYQLPEEGLSEIMKDPRKAATVLKQHILPEYLCCSAFRGDWFTNNRRRTMDGGYVPLQRHLDGTLTAGDARVTACDQIATNGVIHAIDHVLIPKNANLPFLSGTRRVGLPGLELLFG